MKHFPLYLLAAALTLTACRSSKHAVAGSDSGVTAATPAADSKKADAKAAALVGRIQSHSQTANALTARLKINLKSGSKTFDLGGSLRMKRNEVVQISLTMLGFEVARMEFAPDGVLLIDRVNKQYVKAAYTDLSFLRQARLDFYALQAMFWAEVFEPGQQGSASPTAFAISRQDGQTMLTLPDAPALRYAFSVDESTACLTKTEVSSKKSNQNATFAWTYADYQQVDSKPFPTRMTAAFRLGTRDGGFTLGLSRIDHNADWETHTKVSSKYTQQKAEELLGRLLKGG